MHSIQEQNLSIWEIFINHCTEEGDDIEKRTSELQEKTFYPDRKDMIKTLSNLSSIVFSVEENQAKEMGIGQPNRAKRDFMNWARVLHSIFNIPTKKFIAQVVVEELEQCQRHISGKDVQVFKLNIKSDEEEDQKEFIKTYTSAFAEPLRKAKNNLIVYDYLEKQNYTDPEYLDPYFDAHTELYAQIEQKISETNFKYIRFLALPLRFEPNKQFKDFCQRKKYLVLLASVLDHCSIPLFEHICKCIFLLSDRFDLKNSGFFLVSQPPRAYHWATLDSGAYIISEYYRYSVYDICKPDILVINKKSENSKNLFEVYNKEKRSLLKPKKGTYTHNHFIEASKIKEAIETLVNYSEYKLEETEKDYKENELSNEVIYAEKHYENTQAKLEVFKKIYTKYQYELSLS